MGKNVLIVDDSTTMRRIVARALRQAGLNFGRTIEAVDGRQALEMLAEHRVDIVLTDINMPNMNGLEFLQAKAQDARIRDIPVIMISSASGTELLRQARSYGAKGVVKKPFTPDQLQATLGHWL